MPKLISFVEANFGTDFAILNASQEDAYGSTESLTSFAASGPGFVSMECGHKYSRIHIRAERWDGRPPLTDAWEDSDDLPFEEIPSAGDLMLSGFDPGDVGLDLSDLGRARVQVLARGRHRYHYTSDADVDVDALEPEEWLLRFYPWKGATDPMMGGPRRIAGGGGLTYTPGTPWLAAIMGFRTTGWSNELSGSHGFYLANFALYSVGAPATRMELAQHMARSIPPYQVDESGAEALEVPARASLQGEPDPLATFTSLESIVTIGDVIDAMIELGLLVIEARAGEELLAPNPSPQPVWERIEMAGSRLVWSRRAALEVEHHGIASNIQTAVNWRGSEGLGATPRAMAIRWSTTITDVVGAIRMLTGSSLATSDRELGFDAELKPDEVVRLFPPRRG